MSSSVTPIVIALVVMATSVPANADVSSPLDCRQCHSDIFNLWKGSLHGKSYTNASFQAAYVTTLLEEGTRASEHCLRCHAPRAHRARDFDLNSELAAEGVSCSFCHSIAAVRGTHIDTCYQFDTDGIFYGPYAPTGAAAGHESRVSSLHLSAELCAGCHEYTNEQGVTVLGTYSEWKSSPYPGGNVHCQNCHMPMVYDLSAVDDEKLPNWFVTAHEFRGGSSKINLEHAAQVETEVTKENGRCNVTVSITNAESGHMLPTGVPLRKLVLNVVMLTSYNQEIGSARRVYRKVLTDKYGAILENPQDMFLDAAYIYSDNRIKPKETRVEEFVFDIPPGVRDFNIETTLNYEYNRRVLREEIVSVEMSKNVVKSSNIGK